jgi:hypothetical protein
MNARRLTLATLATLCTVAVALLLASAPALAAAPTIEGESVSEVGSSGARLSAVVNPGGAPSEYFFEYGPSAAYGSATQAASVGAGSEGVAVFAKLSGLQPETEYHFRVVAQNASGETAFGGDATFTTAGAFPPAPLGLPDGRGYEEVSPYMENANVFTPDGDPSFPPFEVAPDGDAVSYVGAPSVGGNGSTSLEGNGGNAYLATRAAGGGWAARAINPPGSSVPDDGGPYYVGFTSDLSEGFLATGEALLEGDGGGLYARDLADGGYSFLSASGGYFGSTADGSHVLVESGGSLDDFTGGRLVPVSVLPDDAPASGVVTFGGPGREERVGRGRENGLPVFGQAISEDGSRIFWSTLELVSEEPSYRLYRPSALYVREDDASADARTVQVDAAEPGCGSCGAGGGGQFWTASSDGSRVYFTDENRLTADSTAAAGEPDLYVYDVETGSLTDLSVDANPGEHADVAGLLGAGESAEGGAYVYFVAIGALASGAIPGTDNLYVVHEGEPPRFIATLSIKDNNVTDASGSNEEGDWIPYLGQHTAEATPDGRHLAFILGEGGRSEEEQVFVYDAVSGGLTCVSCGPVGSRGASAVVPVSFNGTYQPRFISDDGSVVFFESGAQLTQRAGGGGVYEWERDGSGSCRLSAGCVYLLSSGVEGSAYGTGDAVSLLGASASGDDVFFVTREQLVAQDGDEDEHVYDARVGAVQPLAAVACTISGCQGAPVAPPVFATPASVTFAGVGNFPAPSPAVKPKPKSKPAKCGKGYAKRRGKCVKRPRARRMQVKRVARSTGRVG